VLIGVQSLILDRTWQRQLATSTATEVIWGAKYFCQHSRHRWQVQQCSPRWVMQHVPGHRATTEGVPVRAICTVSFGVKLHNRPGYRRHPARRARQGVASQNARQRYEAVSMKQSRCALDACRTGALRHVYGLEARQATGLAQCLAQRCNAWVVWCALPMADALVGLGVEGSVIDSEGAVPAEACEHATDLRPDLEVGWLWLLCLWRPISYAIVHNFIRSLSRETLLW
jgi:hypothetical protein